MSTSSAVTEPPLGRGRAQASAPWLSAPSFWLAATAALLAAAGNGVGLLASGAIYGSETAALANAAAAQDLVTLLVVAPLLVVLGRRACRGHLPAFLVWWGCVAFTVYNEAIYAFSISFGPLFLLWVAVLALSTSALLGSLVTVDARAVRERVASRAPRWPAWLLIAVAALFALLWLSEIVPDLLAGGPSRSASTWQVPTNPVHVLDLAFFLPACVSSGILLLRGHRWGFATAPGLLAWLALTSLPILLTPLVASARGDEPGWAVVAPVGAVLLASLAALASLLRAAGAVRPSTQGRDR